jgi:hypothetical protein
MLAGCRTLRDMERLTEEMGESERAHVPRRVPDTTLYEFLGQLATAPLREKLRQQVRSLWRSKCLPPEGLPCGVVSIDGKCIGALDHDADGRAQKAHSARRKSEYYLARVLRAVLTSAAARPCLDQRVVPASTNEMGAFPEFWKDVVAAYGALDLFEIVTADAGFTSRANADRIHAADKAYVLALKETQPELMAEATRLLRNKRLLPAQAETSWEKAQGKEIRRRLYRTAEIAGYHGWDHLQQVWLVLQETRDKQGRIGVEERYFLTSLRTGRLSPVQILAVVRGHWGIENDCFGTLDVAWREDDLPWSTTGRTVEVLGLLRLMAYNLLQMARKRHLRSRVANRLTPAAPWRAIFEWVRQAFRLPLLNAPKPVPS